MSIGQISPVIDPPLFNAAMDELVRSGLVKRLLAQTDIQYSNSMIEAWWRVLKHQWLYLNRLENAAAVQKQKISDFAKTFAELRAEHPHVATIWVLSAGKYDGELVAARSCC